MNTFFTRLPPEVQSRILAFHAAKRRAAWSKANPDLIPGKDFREPLFPPDPRPIGGVESLRDLS
ncbi:MAG: hypothetical protein F6K42_00570 [Leptolyngbya sp. SIO1D8]|nr:hypothetical protein [Leptolyngbya sp. SIO1D8]